MNKSHREAMVEQEHEVAEVIAQFLADTYVLYVKTQNFHWNVVDPRFFFLHKMFEEQYENLAEATDLLAEQMRSLKFRALGSMKQFLSHASLEESEGDLSADEMLHELVNDHQKMMKDLGTAIEEIQNKDQGAADLLIERLRFHEKTAWMLRSHLQR